MRPGIELVYTAPEHSQNNVRTGTLFPIALARWKHNTAGMPFEQLVSIAAKLFAAALEGREQDPPFDAGPADVAALLTILADRRRELQAHETAVLDAVAASMAPALIT